VRGWLVLAGMLGSSGCDGCVEVRVEDDGEAGGYPPFVAESCEEFCAERYRRWGCLLEVCGSGCTQESIALFEAVDCYDTYIAWGNCVLEVADSCNDGCPRAEGEAMVECSQKIEDYEKEHSKGRARGDGGGGGAGGSAAGAR
jgi:hypothetical protein